MRTSRRLEDDDRGDHFASGSAVLLGSTANANFSLGVKDGEVTDVTAADVKATIIVGGASGLKMDGTFHVDYGVQQTRSSSTRP